MLYYRIFYTTHIFLSSSLIEKIRYGTINFILFPLIRLYFIQRESIAILHKIKPRER